MSNIPTYEYRCPYGHTLTDFEPMSAPTERPCRECNRPIDSQDFMPPEAGVVMKRVIGGGADATTESERRFEVISYQSDVLASIKVIRDTKTGAEYLVVKQGYGCAVTRMQ